MRIVAGDARGRRLQALPGDDTRPTLERVKEGMFSAVQNWLPGAAVLDLYAGSGQLGLEALSRGAARCVFVDEGARAVEIIRANAETLGYTDRCRITRSSVELFLARCDEKFDLILADPPYRQGAFPALLEPLAAVAAPGAIILCETEPGADLPQQAAGLALEKQYRYGTVAVSRYRKPENEETTE